MLTRLRTWFILALLLSLVPSAAYAQGAFVRLWPNQNTGSIDANDESVAVVNARGMGTIGIQVTGTFTGTLTPQCTLDGTNYGGLRVTPNDTTTAVTTIVDTAGIWSGSIAGCTSVRLLASGWTGGTAVVSLNTIQTGGGSGGGGGAAGAVSVTDGVDTALVSAGGELSVVCATCSGSGVSHIDDAVFAPAADDVVPIGGVFDDTATDSVNEGDAGAIRMSANRNAYTTIRDAAGNERGALVTAANELLVELGAGAASIGILGANSGVDIGDVTLTAGAADIGNVNLEIGGTAITAGAGAVAATTPRMTLASDDPGVASLAVIQGDTTDIETATELLDNIVVLEDAVAGSAFAGVGFLAVRQDSHVDLAADGDFIPPTIDADGGLRVSIVAGAGSGGTAIADGATVTPNTTSGTPIIGIYEASVSACTSGDGCVAGLTTGRALKVHISAADGSSQTLASDQTVGTAFGTSGPGILAMYQDFDGAALATPTNVDTELEAVQLSASIKGVLYTSPVNEDGSKSPYVDEDVASAAADLLTKVGAIRDDTLDARSATEGDWEMLHLNANGALWAVDVNSASALTALQTIDNLVLAEDVAAGDAGPGLAVYARRTDAVASSSTTDGDLSYLTTDSSGRLWVNVSTGSVSCSNCSGSGASDVDDSSFTIATDSVAPAGFLADQTGPDSVDEGDVGLARMTLARIQLNTLWDAAGNERGANVNASNQLTVIDANSASALTALQLIDDAVSGTGFNISQLAGATTPMTTTQANDLANTLDSLNVTGFTYFFDGATWDRWTGALSANSGVDIGDVTLTAGAASIGTLGANSGVDIGDVTLTAGTNLVGRVALDAQNANGGTTLKYTSAGTTEDEHAVCSGPCNLYSITVTNTNAAARYIRCENDTAANTTPGSETVELDLAIPGATTGAGFTTTFPVGANFATAATCWLVTGAADTDVAEVAANEIKIFYTFKI